VTRKVSFVTECGERLDIYSHYESTVEETVLSYFKLTILKSDRKNNKNIRIASGAEKNIWTEERRSDRRLEETA
jgi:hypothetical protein